MRVRLGLMFFALAMLGVASASGQEATGSANGTDHSSPQPTAPTEHSTRIGVGGNVASANITHMVPPTYPPIAKTAHISGTVILHCVIATDGTMKEVSYV